MTFDVLVTRLINWITTNGIKLVIGFIVLFIGWKLIGRVVKVMNSMMERKNIDRTLQSFLDSFVAIVLKIILVMYIVGYVGGEATSIAAIFASAGLAVGLALQGSLSNFAGGVIILFMRPFNVGDYIEGAGQSGTVEKIGMFYTHILSADNKEILIPNGNLSNGTVVNYSAKETRRVDLTFGVGYEEDVLRVKSVLEDIISKEPLIIKEPAPFVALSEHAASSVNFIVRVWCKTPDYWKVHYNLLEQVKIRFDEEKISIPYPQMDLHIQK